MHGENLKLMADSVKDVHMWGKNTMFSIRIIKSI